MAIEFNTSVAIEQGTSFADLFEDTTGEATWYRLWTGNLDDDGNILEGGYVDVGTDGSGWVKASELADVTVGEDQFGHNTLSVQPWNEADGHGDFFYDAGAMDFPAAPEGFTFSIVEDDITGDAALDQLITFDNIPDGVAEEDVWFKFMVDGEPIETEYGRGWVRASDLADETFSAEYVGKELTVEASSPEDFDIPEAQSWTVTGFAPADTLELSSDDDYVAPSDADMPDDYTYQETDDGNNLVKGVVSSLSTERTLNPDDIIDGGGGEDELAVSMEGNFTGFSEDGGMTNVETVKLTNDSSIGRSFDATGIEGVDKYILNAGDAALSLNNLADASAEVEIKDQDLGSMSIAYSDDAELDEAAQSITLDGVGEDAAVALNIDDVPELNLTSVGENAVDLSNTEAATATVAGDGDLEISDVGADLESFSAAESTGDIDIDVTGADALSSFVGGKGDDEITASTASLQKNAEIDGGDGNNQLNLGGNGTVQYNMANVQTVAVGTLADKLNFSAKESSGIETLVATEDMADEAVFSSMGGADISINLLDDSSGSLNSDHEGTTTVYASASEDASSDDTEVSSTDVSATNSGAMNITIDEYMTFLGDITANEALSVEASIGGEMDSDVSLEKATSGVFNAADAVTVDLSASSMKDLNVVAEDVFFLDGGSDLSGLESLVVETDDEFISSVALDSIATVELTGNGQVDLPSLGDEDQDYGISVAASGLDDDTDDGVDALSITEILVGEGQTISLDAANVLGSVNIGDMEVALSDEGELTGSIDVNLDGTGEDASLGNLMASDVTVEAEGLLGNLEGTVITADTASIVGSELGQNVVIVGATEEASVTGGIEDDLITAVGTAAEGEAAHFTLTGGLGADVYDVTNSLAGDTAATITDFNVDDDTLIGDIAAYADAAVWSDAETASETINDAFDLSASDDDVAFYDEAGDEADTGAYLVYDGNTYLLNLEDDTILELSGVDSEEVTDIFGAGPAPEGPELLSTTPEDGDTDVDVADDLSMTFDEDVQAGTGDIVIGGGEDPIRIDVTSDLVEFDGDTVTVDPEADLSRDTDYFVRVPDGAIEDLDGNAFEGISREDWNFTTADGGGDYTTQNVEQDDVPFSYDTDELRDDDEPVYYEFGTLEDETGDGNIRNFSEGDKLVIGSEINEDNLYVETGDTYIGLGFAEDFDDSFPEVWLPVLRGLDEDFVDDVAAEDNVMDQIDVIGSVYGEDWIVDSVA